MIYLIFSALLPPILCQFVADMEMKPDVAFGEENDRFDLTSFVQQQNKVYDRYTYNREEDEYFRRQGNAKKGGGVKIIYPNGVVEDFASSADTSKRGGTVADYHKNLKKLLTTDSRKARRLIEKLHEDVHAWRRSNGVVPKIKKEKYVLPTDVQVYENGNTELLPDPEKEVMMHYAVPVEMTIEGYLQAPLVV